MNHVTKRLGRSQELVILNSRTSSSCFKSIKVITTRSTYRNSGLNESNDEAVDTNEETYTVFTNGGHAEKNWCLVMKARRWRINKNCK